MNTHCKWCAAELGDADERREGTHRDCQDRLGLPPGLPTSRRKRAPCARCHHPVLLRCLMRERATDEDGQPRLRPLQLGYLPTVQRSLLGKPVVEPDTVFALGALEAWVCRACGFVDIHAILPEGLPVGPEHGNELYEFKDGPYR